MRTSTVSSPPERSSAHRAVDLAAGVLLSRLSGSWEER